MHRDAIAIFVFDRRRNEWAYRRLLQPSDSPQGLFHLPPFQGQLMFVIDVLINAAAATSEVWATRLDPMGRSGNNAFQFRLEKFLVFARDVCRNGFSIDDIRHKHGLTIRARDAFPAEGDIGDLELHSSCHPERSRGIPDEFTFTLPRRDPSIRYASLRMTEF